VPLGVRPGIPREQCWTPLTAPNKQAQCWTPLMNNQLLLQLLTSCSREVSTVVRRGFSAVVRRLQPPYYAGCFYAGLAAGPYTHARGCCRAPSGRSPAPAPCSSAERIDRAGCGVRVSRASRKRERCGHGAACVQRSLRARPPPRRPARSPAEGWTRVEDAGCPVPRVAPQISARNAPPRGRGWRRPRCGPFALPQMLAAALTVHGGSDR
jgi:hypothetical protein